MSLIKDRALSNRSIGSASIEPNQSYRSDIDGLRAVAVLSVLLFHLDRQILPGGFAGVDIFFVISGYLITNIIYREVQAGNFSIVKFYERRIRRIYPALIMVMAATVTAGLIIHMPDELRDLGASIVSTVLFCSNILFWLQVDYFGGPAEFKPLLHTWSLAVEEQFYIFFPPLVLLLVRFSHRLLKPVVIGLLLLSFVLSCAWTRIDASGNFFLPHTRAWELLIGSALALGLFPVFTSVALRQVASVVGIVALLAPFALLNEGSPFPAWNAVSTCLGTALLIHTGRGRATIGAKLLSTKPLVAVGLISYSVYLIHWPLIAFSRYELMRDPTAMEIAAIGLCSLALGWLSWRFVEQPFRGNAGVGRRLLFGSAAIACGILAAFGAVALATKGLPQRLGKDNALAFRNDVQATGTPGCFLKGDWNEWRGEDCFLTAKGNPVTLLWGDSHANHFASVLRNFANASEESVLLYASAGCAPVVDVDLPLREHCRNNNRNALDIIQKYSVKRVVLSAYWERIFRLNKIDLMKLKSTIRKLMDIGVEVSVIGDNPDYAFANPHYLAARLAKRQDPNEPYYADVRNSLDFNARLKEATTPAAFFDPMTALCQERKCLAFRNMQPLMHDNAHFSHIGAAIALREMRPFKLDWESSKSLEIIPEPVID